MAPALLKRASANFLRTDWTIYIIAVFGRQSLSFWSYSDFERPEAVVSNLTKAR